MGGRGRRKEAEKAVEIIERESERGREEGREERI